MTADVPIQVFSTCPHSSSVAKDGFAERLIEIARWSEDAGCAGMLVFSDNSSLDPWLLSHIILQHTSTLCPLVAIQPVYMHPYWVAKQISSLAYLHNRRLCLNMVAGGFKNDLEALDDTTPHDRRYARLVEYTAIVMGLLRRQTPLTYTGQFHRVSKLKLMPPLPEALVPDVFVSGSSEAGMAAARALDATAVKYPRAPGEEDAWPDDRVRHGIRVGIVAREREGDAWDVARARFPEDARGQVTRQLAQKVSDSVWHAQLSERETTAEASPYWMVPFQNYKAMCPYLVGSYEQVGEEMAKYLGAGYRTVILDVPPSFEELQHSVAAINAAMQLAR